MTYDPDNPMAFFTKPAPDHEEIVEHWANYFWEAILKAEFTVSGDCLHTKIGHYMTFPKPDMMAEAMAVLAQLSGDRWPQIYEQAQAKKERLRQQVRAIENDEAA